MFTLHELMVRINTKAALTHGMTHAYTYQLIWCCAKRSSFSELVEKNNFWLRVSNQVSGAKLV